MSVGLPGIHLKLPSDLFDSKGGWFGRGENKYPYDAEINLFNLDFVLFSP